jgi:hypothetical protein
MKGRVKNEQTTSGDSELVNVGIAKSSHARLHRLKEDGHFADMVDAYRFAVGLALAHGGIETAFTERQNLFNVGTLDPDRWLHTAVAALRQESTESVYRTVERLATWGVDELDRRAETSTLSFADILEEAEHMITGTGADSV